VDTDFVHLFTMTTKAMRIVKTAILQEHGVYLGQDHMLELLWQSDGLTPREIATKLGHAVPTVVKMTQRMESTGLVARRPDARDRRLVRIYLSDRGAGASGVAVQGVGRFRAADDLPGSAPTIWRLWNTD